MRQAIILAGGKGTRLQARLGDIPKPMVNIAGKPLLEHQILLAKQHDFSHIIITVHYQAEKIKAYFGDGKKWNLTIEYIEEQQPLGTAGAILANLNYLADNFLVMYGDTMLNVDLSQLWQTHIQQQADSTLFLHPNDHPQDSDLVETDNNDRILAFHPYPHSSDHYYPNLVNAALYIIQKNALLPWREFKNPIDFGKELFPAMLRKGLYLYGYRSTEYIKDAGTPERLDKVCTDLYSGKIQRGSLQISIPAIFLDRDGTLNHEIGYIRFSQDLNLIDNVSYAVKRFNQAELRTIVITNQPVVARGDCTEADLKQIHNKLETLLGREGAYLDAIYYCPHHPDKGFPNERSDLKIQCLCRKPEINLVQAAQKKFNVDMPNSWFIGDSTIDIQTAKNAGLRSILVRTGKNGCDDKYGVRPDFECFDLQAAADFILDKFPTLLSQARLLTTELKPGDHIALGGLARSGKSTWATLIRYALTERHIPVAIISLDGWLKNQEDRTQDGVLSRYDLPAIVEFIAKIKNISSLTELNIPSYNRLARNRNQQTEKITISPSHVVIFEGVIALLIDKLQQSTSHLFYVDCSEEVRKYNFHREYISRGLSDMEIKALYQAREKDETPVILSSKTRPDIVCINEI